MTRNPRSHTGLRDTVIDTETPLLDTFGHFWQFSDTQQHFSQLNWATYQNSEIHRFPHSCIQRDWNFHCEKSTIHCFWHTEVQHPNSSCKSDQFVKTVVSRVLKWLFWYPTTLPPHGMLHEPPWRIREIFIILQKIQEIRVKFHVFPENSSKVINSRCGRLRVPGNTVFGLNTRYLALLTGKGPYLTGKGPYCPVKGLIACTRTRYHHPVPLTRYTTPLPRHPPPHWAVPPGLVQHVTAVSRCPGGVRQASFGLNTTEDVDELKHGFVKKWI